MAVRKKVVSSFLIRDGRNYFHCTLECGHSETAYGMNLPGIIGPKQAPKTCKCTKCTAAANQNNPA